MDGVLQFLESAAAGVSQRLDAIQIDTWTIASKTAHAARDLRRIEPRIKSAEQDLLLAKQSLVSAAEAVHDAMHFNLAMYAN